MDERKLKAAGKVAVGVVRIVSGVVTGTGHGLLGTFLRSSHQLQAAAQIGRYSIQGGQRMISEGMRDLRDG